jgi:arylsulfatase
MWFASNDAHRDWQYTDLDRRYDPAKVLVPPYLFDGPQTRADLADHLHEVSRLDRFVGDVRRELEREGVADNTYIIFTADNGRPFPRCKTRLYDSGAKPPLVVWRPGTVNPGRTSSLVSVIDVAPTILSLAGIELDKRLQGVSFAPLLSDPHATVRDYAFAEHNWHVGQAHERSVREGDWLYIRNAYPELQSLCAESGPVFPAGKELWAAHEAGKLGRDQQDVFLQPRLAEELYQVKDDPHQLHNLSGDPQQAETLSRLRAVLDRWVEQTGDSVQQRATPTVALVGARQHVQPEFKRGDMPGADRNAMAVTASGPIRKDQ